MSDWILELKSQAPWLITIGSGLVYTARWLALNVLKPLTAKHIEYLQTTTRQFGKQTETLQSMQECLRQISEHHRDVVRYQQTQMEICRDKELLCPLRELDAVQLSKIHKTEKVTQGHSDPDLGSKSGLKRKG